MDVLTNKHRRHAIARAAGGFIPSRDNSFIAMLIVAGLVTCAMTIKCMLGVLPDCGVAGFAIVAACVVAIDLWLLASDGPFLRRIAIAFGSTCIIGLGIPLGEFFAGPDLEYYELSWGGPPSNVSVWLVTKLLIAHRICAISIISFASFFFHVCSRRRLTFRDTPVRHTFSLRDIFLLVMMLAATTAILRNWVRMAVVGENQWSVAVGACLFVELVVLFVHVLGPVFISFRWRFFGAIQLIWPISLGALAFYFGSNFSIGAVELQTARTLHWVFAVAITLLLLVARRYRLRMAVIPKAQPAISWESESGSPPALWASIRFSAAFSIAVSIAIAAFNRFVDIETVLVMPSGSKFENGRKAAMISKLVGSRPDNSLQQVNWEISRGEGDDYVYIDFDPQSPSLEIARDQKVREILSLGPADKSLHVFIRTPSITPQMVQPVFGKRLRSLVIDSSEIDPQAIADLSERASINWLRIDSGITTVEQLEPLERHAPLVELDIYFGDSPVSQAIIDQLAQLPLSELSCRLPNSAIDLSRLMTLNSLEICNSKLSATTLLSLPVTSTRIWLVLNDCEFTTDGAKFAESVDRTMVAELAIRYEKIEPDDVRFFLSLVNCEVISFRFEGDCFDHIFAKQFNRRHGGYVVELNDDVDVLFALATSTGPGASAAFDQAIDRIAHSAKRNERGDLIEVDLQNFCPRARQGIRLLREHAPWLRRVRIDNVDYSRSFCRALESFSDLESLEIPNGKLSIQDYEAISRTSQLRRLQLPMGSGWWSAEFGLDVGAPADEGRTRFRPEEMLFDDWEPSQFAGVATSLSDKRMGFQLHDLDDFEDTEVQGLNLLGTLENLEYLFMPGFALFEKTLPTIESFSKLETLHAPFSYLTNDELNRIAELKQIRDLAVGSDGFSEETVTILGSMQHLSSLRLFVFDDIAFNSNDQERIHRRLSVLLPKCQVRVYLLPSID